jgi:uncharacterized protein YndB with AHSA1/START domain
VRVTVETVLPVPIERAWEALTAWEEQPRWMRDAAAVTVLGSRREGVGTTIAVRTRVLGVPLFTERLEATIWEPPRRLVMAHRSAVRGVGTWRLQPVEDGTWFSWTEDLRLPVPVLGELALRAYRPVLRRLMGAGLAALRASLSEGSPPVR